MHACRNANASKILNYSQMVNIRIRNSCTGWKFLNTTLTSRRSRLSTGCMEKSISNWCKTQNY